MPFCCRNPSSSSRLARETLVRQRLDRLHEGLVDRDVDHRHGREQSGTMAQQELERELARHDDRLGRTAGVLLA